MKTACKVSICGKYHRRYFDSLTQPYRGMIYMVCQITEVSIVRLVMMNVSKCGQFINNVGFGWYESMEVLHRI